MNYGKLLRVSNIKLMIYVCGAAYCFIKKKLVSATMQPDLFLIVLNNLTMEICISKDC